MTLWKAALLLLVAVFVLTTTTACETVAGAGRDVQAVGEGVEHGAESVQPY
jgi:predicted small secreted protein